MAREQLWREAIEVPCVQDKDIVIIPVLVDFKDFSAVMSDPANFRHKCSDVELKVPKFGSILNRANRSTHSDSQHPATLNTQIAVNMLPIHPSNCTNKLSCVVPHGIDASTISKTQFQS